MGDQNDWNQFIKDISYKYKKRIFRILLITQQIIPLIIHRWGFSAVDRLISWWIFAMSTVVYLLLGFTHWMSICNILFSSRSNSPDNFCTSNLHGTYAGTEGRSALLISLAFGALHNAPAVVNCAAAITFEFNCILQFSYMVNFFI